MFNYKFPAIKISAGLCNEMENVRLLFFYKIHLISRLTLVRYLTFFCGKRY